ncbi:ATP-binding protein [Streptomyces sp. V4-01]|uniref:ATP-binding protein n=1 Tax=Actinacidiphila polyblastidii TaxID=3110430 RepID=A0ABU7PL87_9ACTN|nr:ATP-binding protein [Streptomyces sp. V4-01]
MTASGPIHRQTQTQTRRLPLRAGAAFDGGSESIAAARDFCSDFLHAVERGAGPPAYGGARDRLLADMQLVVSELVTNACKYAPGPTALALEIRGASVEISLWDTCGELPAIGRTGPAVVGRHGLEIVLAVCEAVDVRPEPVGKRVIATLALPAGDPAAGAR